MSFTSSNNLSGKYVNKSSSKHDGSEESDGHSNSIQYTENKCSIESIEQSSIYENSSSTRSVKTKISPISTAVNYSVDEKVESCKELEDIEICSTKRLQTDSDSVDSHTHSTSNYNQKINIDFNKIIEGQLGGDLQLPLAEEQDASVISFGNKNLRTKKGLTNNVDPIENLVLATLAFREASNNQCDLLRVQTSAINRLATAIEDQNVMMSRFHTITQKTSIKNLPENDSPLRDDKE